jgi:hypothetical protein
MEMSAAGKGDDYRYVNLDKYNSTLNNVFGKKCPLCGNYTSHINNKIRCNTLKCEFEEDIPFTDKS